MPRRKITEIKTEARKKRQTKEEIARAEMTLTIADEVRPGMKMLTATGVVTVSKSEDDNHGLLMHVTNTKGVKRVLWLWKSQAVYASV